MSNFRYIASQMEKAGFDYSCIDRVKSKMEAGEINIAEGFHRKVNDGTQRNIAMLSKSKEEDFYFFNGFRSSLAIVEKDGNVRIEDAVVYINKSHNHTVEEIELLQRGGAIKKEQLNKEQAPYIGWVTRDKTEVDRNGFPIVKAFHPNYGFDEVEALKRRGFREAFLPDRLEPVLSDLKAGLPVHLTKEIDGLVKDYNVYLDVKYKDVVAFHLDGSRLSKDERIELFGQAERLNQSNEEQLAEQNRRGVSQSRSA